MSFNHNESGNQGGSQERNFGADDQLPYLNMVEERGNNNQ